MKVHEPKPGRDQHRIAPGKPQFALLGEIPLEQRDGVHARLALRLAPAPFAYERVQLEQQRLQHVVIVP